MVALGNELAGLAVMADDKLAVLNGDVALAGVEGKGEAYLRGVLRDVDEAAGADASAGELGNIHVAGGVYLRAAEHGHVKAAAVVEREGVRGAGDGVGVDRRAE